MKIENALGETETEGEREWLKRVERKMEIEGDEDKEMKRGRGR